MKSTIAFDNVDNSPALKKFIAKKARVLKRVLRSGESASWTIKSDSKIFEPTINLKLRDKSIAIHSRAENAYKAVMLALEKARRSVLRDHRKQQVH